MTKVPRDAEMPEAWVRTPVDVASQTLNDWVWEHFGGTAGGVRLGPDHESVVIYWKGAPPAELQRLADAQSVPVEFQAAAYSLAELIPIVKGLVTDHSEVDAAWPSNDFGGIDVILKSAAPAGTLARLQADAGVPVTCKGIGDSVSL